MAQVIKVAIALLIMGFVIYQGIGLFAQIRERVKARKHKKASFYNAQDLNAKDESSEKGGEK